MNNGSVQMHARSRRRSQVGRGIFPSLVLLAWTVITAVPLLLLLSVALKSGPELIRNPFGWPQRIDWSNFTTAWAEGGLGNAFLNSLLITVCSVGGLVLVGSLAAYPLARIANRWSTGLYTFFVAGLVIPTTLSIIPLFQLMHSLGLLETYQGVILVHVAQGLPFVVFLYTGFIKGIPSELDEAAVIDGASPLRVFWNVVFPLLTPVTATVVILTSLWIWNDFLTPLMFLQNEARRPIPIAILNFTSEYVNNWQYIFASVIMTVLPIVIVYLALQRYIVKGLAGGALKG